MSTKKPEPPPPGGSRSDPPTKVRKDAREFSAGGVVVHQGAVAVIVPTRRGPDGRRVLALPKGHPDPGESPEAAATREVREETGLRAEIVESLGEVSYHYQRDGRPILKAVAFYLFRYLDGRLEDHDDEVQEARWMPLAEAARQLTFAGEREMVTRAASRSEPDQ